MAPCLTFCAPSWSAPRSPRAWCWPCRCSSRRRPPTKLMTHAHRSEPHPMPPGLEPERVSQPRGLPTFFQDALLVERADASSGRVERTFDVNAAEYFLRNYWQQRPVLFRRTLESFHSPLSPDELAGLACEADVESRIIIHWEGVWQRSQKRLWPRKHPPWELRLGPFTEEDFEELPEDNYTLLVQEVNGHIQEVSNLLDHFRFLPNWRMDDVMVSYATEGGGVGPHVDSYDVFLLQAKGRRRWCISYKPIAPSDEILIPNIDVRVLQGGFQADEELILEPGDMLYVPARIPHWGVSMDNDCMTFSIGMRAPDKREMVRSLSEHLIERRIGEHDNQFTDDVDDICECTLGRGVQSPNPGIISKRTVQAVRQSLQSILKLDEEHFARWFARQVTLPKRSYPDLLGDETEDAATVMTQAEAANIVAEIYSNAGVSLRARAATVFAYLPSSDDQEEILYANGAEFQMGPASNGTAELLCSEKVLSGASLQQHMMVDAHMEELLVHLVRRGLFTCVYDEDSL